MRQKKYLLGKANWMKRHIREILTENLIKKLSTKTNKQDNALETLSCCIDLRSTL